MLEVLIIIELLVLVLLWMSKLIFLLLMESVKNFNYKNSNISNLPRESILVEVLNIKTRSNTIMKIFIHLFY